MENAKARAAVTGFLVHGHASWHSRRRRWRRAVRVCRVLDAGLLSGDPRRADLRTGQPVFDRVTIQLHNGKQFRLIAKDNSVDNKYIDSVRFNGEKQDRVWFRHSDILDGLTWSWTCPAFRTRLLHRGGLHPAVQHGLDPATLQETVAKTP